MKKPPRGARLSYRRRRRARPESTNSAGTGEIATSPEERVRHVLERDARRQALAVLAPAQAEDQPATTAANRLGWWSMVKSWIRAPTTMTDGPTPVPGEDPLRHVLAIPRGVARLDAFESALAALRAGTPGHRLVALAYHEELTSLAERAGIDVSLLEARIDACSRALVAAAEAELAGHLLSRIGARHKAAELFVAAGAIDALEETHAQLHFEEGGSHLDARLAYERHAALLGIGRRDQALAALGDAVRLWPGNNTYRATLAALQDRVPAPGKLVLRHDGNTLKIAPGWPVTIGRSIDVTLPLASLLVAMRHVLIVQDGVQLIAHDVGHRGTVTVAGLSVEDMHPLDTRGHMMIGGIRLQYENAGDALLLWADASPRQKVCIPFADRLRLPESGNAPALALQFDASGRARALPDERTLLNQQPLEEATLLLAGDILIDADGRSFQVEILPG